MGCPRLQKPSVSVMLGFMESRIIAEVEINLSHADSGSVQVYRALLTVLSDSEFEFAETLEAEVASPERWICSRDRALRYFTSNVQHAIMPFAGTEIVKDSSGTLDFISYRCANLSCGTKLFIGFGEVAGVQIRCRKCKTLSPPFS